MALLISASKHGIIRIDDVPVYYCAQSSVPASIVAQISISYKFVTDLFDTIPAVLVRTIPGHVKPYCIRRTEDMGCAFVAEAKEIRSILVHEFAHLCCMSGHPVFDEGVAFLSEHLFMERLLDTNRVVISAPCSFAEACNEVRFHTNLSNRSTQWQLAFGHAASRVASALYSSGPSLVSYAQTLTRIKPGLELEKHLRHLLPNIEELWNYAEQEDVSPELSMRRHDTERSSELFGTFFNKAKIICSSELYSKEQAGFADEYSEWVRLANIIVAKHNSEESAIEKLYLLVDSAIRENPDAQFEWHNIEKYLESMLRKYPENPYLAVAGIFFWHRLSGEDSSEKIAELFSRWESDKDFGDQLRLIVSGLAGC